MKKIICVACMLMAVTASASDVLRIYLTPGTNDIASISRNTSFSDPQPLKPNEIRLEGATVLPTNAIKYLQWDAASSNVVVMTATEMASKDAAIEAAEEARKDAQREAAAVTTQNRAILKTIANIAGDTLTNVVAVFKTYYKQEQDN